MSKVIASQTNFKGLQSDLEAYIDELLKQKTKVFSSKCQNNNIALRVSLIIANNTEC